MKPATLQEQVSSVVQLPKSYQLACETQLPELLSGERRIAFLTPLAGFHPHST